MSVSTSGAVKIDKGGTQNFSLEGENFLTFKEYSQILKNKYENKDLMKKASKFLMYKLIPSIMPHTADIKADYKIRNELYS